MTFFEHRHVTLNGFSAHFVTAGSGPAVLFCHGFPDLWRGWRRQMEAVAARGYRAIAPDLRGFGESDGPDDPQGYTALDVVGDMTALLDHLGIERAVIVGHDWGATIAWAAALTRPDRFHAVVALSVPYTPRGDESLPRLLARTAPPDFYMLYFLEPGRPEAELDADPRAFLMRLFYSNSAAVPNGRIPQMRLAPSGRFMDALDAPPGGMAWLEQAELDAYTLAFARTGFRRALHTYRSLHRSWELMAAFADRAVAVPALYIGADRDVVLHFPGMKEAVGNMTALLPKAESPVILADAGHFLHWEQPDAVNRHLLAFLDKVRPR